jgi:RNA polymerase sigma-B factor
MHSPPPTPSTPGRSRHPHDDAPDTAEAFRRLARLPEGASKERLRQEIATDWLPMAHRLAGRYRNRGESLDDLRQVAALGLVKAVSRYDPARGTAFESYAVPTIDGEIKRHFRDCMWSVHVPRRVQMLRARVRAAAQELAQSTPGHAPTTAEIAEHAGLTEQETADGLEALESFSSLSLDAQCTGPSDSAGPMSLADTLGAPDPALDVVLDREAVKPQLCRLPEREREILYLRFFGGMTQSMIAERLGISQMHVSRLISRSCSAIRAEVAGADDGVDPADASDTADDTPAPGEAAPPGTGLRAPGDNGSSRAGSPARPQSRTGRPAGHPAGTAGHRAAAAPATGSHADGNSGTERPARTSRASGARSAPDTAPDAGPAPTPPEAAPGRRKAGRTPGSRTTGQGGARRADSRGDGKKGTASRGGATRADRGSGASAGAGTQRSQRRRGDSADGGGRRARSRRDPSGAPVRRAA